MIYIKRVQHENLRLFSTIFSDLKMIHNFWRLIMNETTTALHHWLIFLFPRKIDFWEMFLPPQCHFIETVFITGQIINKVPEIWLHPQSIIQRRKDIISLYVTVRISFISFYHQERDSSDAGRFMTFVPSINSGKFRLTEIPHLPFHILLYHTEIFLRKNEDQKKFWHLIKCNSHKQIKR
jgi:hypothetical protein